MTWQTTHGADLDIASTYVLGERAFGTGQAERYQNSLFQAFDMVAANPRLAHERSEITPPVRLHPYGVHVVVYTLQDARQDTGILIVRVLHGRQDWERWLS
ncbi:type II toxin-antitoxin system RelE/ParE family toxin [uncultured Methylobacterium sp.]|uniref:type II toxin-antitoxin system RelE/ParE family toxin n=1 Tax=uncultured Methylobacterium sp. TaxID=157278 RepID=UPI0035C9B982